MACSRRNARAATSPQIQSITGSPWLSRTSSLFVSRAQSSLPAWTNSAERRVFRSTGSRFPRTGARRPPRSRPLLQKAGHRADQLMRFIGGIEQVQQATIASRPASFDLRS